MIIYSENGVLVTFQLKIYGGEIRVINNCVMEVSDLVKMLYPHGHCASLLHLEISILFKSCVYYSPSNPCIL
jgi:hypothetical protein